MEESSLTSSEDDVICPGPLFRVKVMVLGPAQSGKSSLVQCLLHNAAHSHTHYTPTEGVSVDLWTPFKTQGLQRLLKRKLAGDEHHLILELWDTSGRLVCQPVHGLFVTTRTLCVIVYDVSDGKAGEKVLALYRMIREKFAGSAVVIVGNKSDALQPPEVAQEPLVKERVTKACLQQDQQHRAALVKEVEETKALLAESRPKERDNDARTQFPDPPAERAVAERHLTHLQRRLARATRKHAVRAVTVSATSGKGLDDLRQTLLNAALDPLSFPDIDGGSCNTPRPSTVALYDHGLDELRQTLLEVALDPLSFPDSGGGSISTPRPSTVALYDHVLALRERDLVLLPWKRFWEVTHDAGGDTGTTGEVTLEEDLAFLAAAGAVAEFKHGCITFPTTRHHPHPNLHPQQPQLDEEEHVDKRSSTDTSEKSSNPGGGDGASREERYVCVHPATLASLVCCCLVDDDKVAFRFEAGRFWPRDSGFKHPDPHMLCRVLETIPQLGLLRESLAPLLWQEHPLSEDQVLLALQVLQGAGVLAEHGETKTHCAGLALPHYPRLSVQRSYALPLLSLLPDNRPQLNWTAKPFKGDLQVTWSCHVHVHAGLLQRLLATVVFAGRKCCNYRHMWRAGVLLRVGEATVCVEHPEDGQRLDVSCRLNGDELGREREAVRVLWVTLTPFLQHVRRALLDWPDLHFKETVRALGQQFYLDERVKEEPQLWAPRALSLWQRRAALTFKEGDTEYLLDLKLLFPFTSDSSVVSVDDWLNLVTSQTDAIFSDTYNTMTSSPPPPALDKAAFKRQSMRGSTKQQKKKKSVEVKWKLQEENNNVSNNNNNNATTTTPAPNNNNNHNDAAAVAITKANPDNNVSSPVTALTLTPAVFGEVGAGGRVVSEEEEQAEAVRLASGFVSAILASALAHYVALEAEGDQDGRRLVSTAQITAARVTAEAAVAVQTGDIEGAAAAVIQAVNAVKGGHSPPTKAEGKGGQTQSKLCNVL